MSNTIPPEHHDPVTLKWTDLRRTALTRSGYGRRWTVTASWHDMTFTVAALPPDRTGKPSAWCITRADRPPLTAPRSWTCIRGAKGARWGADGRAAAEAAILAHVARRQAVEAKHRAALAAATERGPRPWRSKLPSLLGPRKRITYTPLEDDPTAPAALERIAALAEQGVTFEVLPG